MQDDGDAASESVHVQSEGDVGVPAYSIVWTTLPILSALCPLVGHLGISDSCGRIYDFSGSYRVTIDSFMCGPARRAFCLDTDAMTVNAIEDLDERAQVYDQTLNHVSRVYEKQAHNLLMNNCHHFVASVLNQLEYKGKTNWTSIHVAWFIWIKGFWLNPAYRLATLTPFIIILIVLSGLTCFLVFHNY